MLRWNSKRRINLSMAFTCCGENKVCYRRSHANVGKLRFLYTLDGFSVVCSLHRVGVSETYLIQLIQRPLPNKQDWKHLASQCAKPTSWLRPGRAAASLHEWSIQAPLVRQREHLTRRPFLLFSLICWPRLSSSNWWTCRYDLPTTPFFFPSDPLEPAATLCWDVFTHCKPLRKAAYTSSSRSGWGVLVGGSLVEPVNILLPYKARFSWIKRCWGKEGKHDSITDKAFIIIWAWRRTERSCSPAECGGNVTTATCWDSLMRHCGSNKHKDMSCNYKERRHFKLKCPSLFHSSLHLTVFLTPPCDYQGFLKWQKPPKE